MQTIGRGLSCLIIDESALNDPDSMPAVMLGLLARAGSAPFLFDLALPYTDYVVGLDLMPVSKRGGDSVTGIVRVYRNDGGLLWYMVASAPVEDGQGVPQSLLAQLFPADYFAGKRALIHYNGVLAEAARQSLDDWSAQLDAVFYPVELSREGAPRLYALANGRIACPLRGSLFRLSANEAFLVSASREHEDFQPLYVRSDALPLNLAVESIMQFAALSYSPVPSAMPATLLNADLIGVSLMRGMMPDNVSGDVPFWL
jgi:argonaute-like protein implicated in RNA metabolism and viral defense